MVDQHRPVAATPVQRDEPCSPTSWLRRERTSGARARLSSASRGRVGVRLRHDAVGEPREDVADAALPRLVAAAARRRCRRRRRRTCPAPRASRVAVHHMAGRRPHDRDQLAGSTAWRRRVTWASTLPTATGDARGQPGPPGGLGRERAGPAAQRRRSAGSSLSATKSREAGVELGEVVGRGVLPVLEDALVAGGAGVADVGAAQLPDDPVGGLDPALDRGVDARAPPRGAAVPWRTPTRRRSARRSGPATASPRAAASSLMRSACGCAAWCFHSFTQACGRSANSVNVAQRRAVGEHRQHRARGEVGGDARRRRRGRSPAAATAAGTAVRSTST